MLLGARQFFEGGGGGYVRDHLIAWYDGIDNIGVGQHDNSSLTWVNLGSLGPSFNAVRGNGEFQSDGAVFVRRDHNAFMIPNHLMTNYMKGEWTYELVFTPDSGWFQGWSGLFGNHGYGFGLVGGQDNGDGSGISFNLYAPVVLLWAPQESEFSAGSTYSVSQAGSTSAATGITWKDAEIVASVSGVDVTLNTPDVQHTMIGAAYVEDGRTNPYAAAHRNFSGVIHCVRVYDKPLTDDEVRQNYMVDVKRFNLNGGA